MKKKVWIGLAIVLLCIAIGVIVFLKLNSRSGSKGKNVVLVESVKDITGNYVGLSNKFMGIVESQDTKGVNKDSSKKVKTVFVKEGDMVKENDPLFEYDTDDMNLTLRQLELDLQGIKNEISGYNDQINSITQQMKTQEYEEKLASKAQISVLKAEKAEAQNNITKKELEIERQKKSIENSVVLSPMDGIVKKINNQDDQSSDDNGDMGMDYYGYSGEESGDNAFITIMAMGNYRIKGTVNELEIGRISEGMQVLVRSRVDDEAIWRGSITSISRENENSATDQNNYDMYGAETASKYTFYVDLEETDNLLLGQHVYIEPDLGQSSVKEGIWLPEYFILEDGGNSYVWARNKKGLLEKRRIEKGEYDEEGMLYEIKSGLTLDDFIAYPAEYYEEGNKTTTDMSEVVVDEGQDDIIVNPEDTTCAVDEYDINSENATESVDEYEINPENASESIDENEINPGNETELIDQFDIDTGESNGILMDEMSDGGE